MKGRMKEDTQMSKKHMKRFSTSLLENANQNHDITLHGH